jgi:FkbM family methyltransferase
VVALAARASAPSVDTRLDPRRPWTDDLLIRLPGDVAVSVVSDLVSVTTYILAEQEDWFEPELAFCRRWFRLGMRAYDVGANHGVYALTLAALAGPGGHVVAFEPGRDVRRRLEKGAAANGLGRLQVRPSAVADRVGRAQLHANGASESASLHAVCAGAAEPVSLTTLDREWKRDGEPPLDLVKIDVEGAEAAVIRGAAHLLDATSPLVMFEISGERARLDELGPLLAAHRYAIYRLLPGPGVLVPALPAQVSRFQTNLFACKPDRAASLARDGLLVPCLGLPLAAAPDDAVRGLRELACWNDAAPGELLRYLRAAGLCDRAARQLAHGLRSRVGSAAARVADLALVADPIAAPTGAGRTWQALATVARCAAEFGAREHALATLSSLSGALDSAAGIEPIPLLPAAPAFDAFPPDGQWDEWLRVMTIDAMISLHCHSTRFTRGEALAPLDRWRHSRFFGPHLERRRQLLAVRLGLQAGLFVTPPLKGHTGRNPELYQ